MSLGKRVVGDEAYNAGKSLDSAKKAKGGFGRRVVGDEIVDAAAAAESVVAGAAGTGIVPGNVAGAGAGTARRSDSDQVYGEHKKAVDNANATAASLPAGAGLAQSPTPMGGPEPTPIGSAPLLDPSQAADIVVNEAYNAQDAIRKAKENPFDLPRLLDLELARPDGHRVTVLRAYQKELLAQADITLDEIQITKLNALQTRLDAALASGPRSSESAAGRAEEEEAFETDEEIRDEKK